MIYFLNVCTEIGVLKTIYLVKKLMELIFFILPLILIVMISIDFFKNVIAKNPDDMKKNVNIAVKRILYCVFAFFVPTIVTLFMNMVYNIVDGSSKETYLDCWANATKENIQAYEDTVKPAGKSDAETQDAYNKWKQQMEANKIKGGLGAKEEETGGDSTGGSTDGTTDDSPSTASNYTIFVGDSRMNGVCKNVSGDNEKCIAKDNTGFGWLNTIASKQIKEELKNHSDANVIIYMGTNDITAYDRYADFYKDLANEYPSAKVVAVSVTPVEEKKAASIGSTLKNKHVTTFNDNLKKALSGSNVKYCDVKNELRNNVGTEDGIHHTASVYKMIYNEMKNCL